MNSIGKRIKKRRKELGYTVEQVANKLGKNRATVYRYENDDIEKMPITVLGPLAEVLETSPAYLMGWTDNEFEIENRPDALIENYEDNAKYILEHEDKELLKVYKDLISDENLVLLVKKASKLSPQEVVQLLKIVNTFDVNDDDPIDK